MRQIDGTYDARRHWRRVFTDLSYCLRWLHQVGASTSSWVFVFWFGGHFAGTLSAEVERRTRNGRSLGPFFRLIKIPGEWLLGRNHWFLTYEREERWLRMTRPPASTTPSQ